MSEQPKDIQLTEENPYTALTILQRRYVEARMQGLAPSAALKASGASKGNNLERSPKVKAAIRYLVKEGSHRANELTKDDIKSGFLDAVEAASTASELVLAWRELGKLIGAYEPERKILEVHDYTKDELKQLSDEDLVKLSGGKYADAIDGEFEEIKRHADKPSAEEADIVDG